MLSLPEGHNGIVKLGTSRVNDSLHCPTIYNLASVHSKQDSQMIC